MKEFLIKYRWQIIFFLLAIVIRLPLLWKMDLINFPEYYRDYYMADQISSGKLPVLGPPSMQAKFHFGPIYYYLLEPLFLIFKKAGFSLVLTNIVLYSLGTIIFYELLKLWLKNEWAAKFGTTFYLISIYGIHLTSYSSNPNLLPLFVCLVFYFLTKISQEPPKLNYYFWTGLCFAIASQLHLTATFVLGSTIIISIPVFIKSLTSNLKFKALSLLTFGTILTNIPYILYEIHSNFENLRTLFKFSQTHAVARSHLSHFSSLIKYFSSVFNPFELSNGYSYIEPNSLYWLILFLAMFLLTLVLNKLIKNNISSNKVQISLAGKLLSLLWLASATIMILLFKKALHSHYFIIFWPLPAVFLSYAALWLKTKLNITTAFATLVIIISLLQIWTFYSNYLNTPWVEFNKIYEQNYKFNPDTPEIGISIF